MGQVRRPSIQLPANQDRLESVKLYTHRSLNLTPALLLKRCQNVDALFRRLQGDHRSAGKGYEQMNGVLKRIYIHLERSRIILTSKCYSSLALGVELLSRDHRPILYVFIAC